MDGDFYKNKRLPFFIAAVGILVLGALACSGSAVRASSSQSSPQFVINLPQGDQVFEVSSSKDNWPKFVTVEIDPLDVKVGDTQKMTVVLQSDNAPIAAVSAEIQHDAGKDVLTLNSAGKDASGNLVFKAQWVVHDTHSEKYKTTFRARDGEGRENTVVMAWTDPCSPPLGGDWSVDGNCSFSGVNGVDNGNLIINNYTLTINAGATFVWNPGKTITITGTGNIVKGAGAQLKKTYLWIKDADSDGYALNATDMLAQDTKPATYERRYSRTGSTDCNDTSASLNVLRSGYIDADGDGYPGTYASNSCYTSAQVSGSPSDCNDSDISQYYGTYLYYYNCTVYNECSNSCTGSQSNYCQSNGSYAGWSACGGCTPAACCTSGYLDYDKDGFGAGSYGCYTPSGSYNIVSNASDCNDGNASLWNTVGAAATDADHDGYYVGTPGPVCTTGSMNQYGGRDYYSTDGSTYPVLNTNSGGTAGDCYDYSASYTLNRTGYFDLDSDGYYGWYFTDSCQPNNINVVPSSYGGCITNPPYYANEGACNDCNDNDVGVHLFVTYYQDADGDGYGNPSVPFGACGTPPSGYVSNSNDCDDGNYSLNILRSGWYDYDGDGYGYSYAGYINNQCYAANVLVGNPDDCYEGSANAHPGQTAYFTSNRGDGSFDYDCNGSATGNGAGGSVSTGNTGCPLVKMMYDSVCQAPNTSYCYTTAYTPVGCGETGVGTWSALSYYTSSNCTNQCTPNCAYPVGTYEGCH